jgi:hypothetical protein
MSNDSKTNFMKTSEFYLKITARQQNSFDNKEILSLIFSEKFSEKNVPVAAYQNRNYYLETRAG